MKTYFVSFHYVLEDGDSGFANDYFTVDAEYPMTFQAIKKVEEMIIERGLDGLPYKFALVTVLYFCEIERE